MNFSLRFLVREMWASRQQAAIFMLCTALSISSLVALNSLARDVNRSISGDARALHGGDLLLRSPYEFSPQLMQAVDSLELGREHMSRTWEFYSVVRDGGGGATLLCNILAAGPSYPLYGSVELQSGESFQRQLSEGYVVVAAELLDHLNVKIGDQVLVGSAVLTVADVVVRESSRPVDVFSFGPRVFVAEADLERLGLVRKGSRVFHGLQLRIPDDGELSTAVKALEDAAVEGQERVNTYRSVTSRLKRFYDNLLFFLSLISVFTLLLAGIGMQSSLSALLRQKEKSLAIIKGLGASYRFLVGHYLSLVLAYGLIGGCLGIMAGAGFKAIFPSLFVGFLPPESVTGVSLADIGEGMILAFLVVCFFTFLPLYRLRQVKPNAIFHHESDSTRKSFGYYLVVACGLFFITLVVVRQLEDVKTGISFMVGSGVLICVTALLTEGAIGVLRRLHFRSLAVRQAARSLLRPGNATRAVTVTLALALSVLLAIYLVEYNLHATYVEAYPEDAPNVFLVDIQPDQRQGVLQVAGQDAEMFPIIRGRLKTINGVDVRKGTGKQRFSDTLTREFNLTYREGLLVDEILAGGESLFQQNFSGAPNLQVSILDMVADMGNMKVGDILEFNVQGVPLTAEVVSVRTRTRSKLYPFFYFVFQPEFMAKAPQTFFAAMRVRSDDVAALQGRVVAAYPNVSLINMTRTAAELGTVMKKLSAIVSFFAFFPILAGVFILVSAIFATRFARVREAVYYKILGSGQRFVIAVFFWENILLGLLSSVVGVVMAQVGSWAVCHYIFEISFVPDWPASSILVGTTLLLITAVGVLSSVPIIREKPALFLREQSLE